MIRVLYPVKMYTLPARFWGVLENAERLIITLEVRTWKLKIVI